jgi:hypothetical protein
MLEGIQRGCSERELCLLVIGGVFIPPILLKNRLKQNGNKHTMDKQLFATIGLMITPQISKMQGGIECVSVCHLKFLSRPVCTYVNFH